MVLRVLSGIFLVAAVALLSYHRSQGLDGSQTGEKITQIRQSTSVVLAVASALVAIMDALQMIRVIARPATSNQTPLSGLGSLRD